MRWVPAASRRDGLRWWLARRRRPLAAALTALAVWTGLLAVRSSPAATTTVLVAARDLAPGTALRAGDLRSVAFPADAVPPTALRPGAAISGHTLAVALPGGVPLTLASLSLGRLLPAGTVATPVRLADPGEAALLHPGDRVDVLAAPTDELGTGPVQTAGTPAPNATAPGAPAPGASASGAPAPGASTPGATAPGAQQPGTQQPQAAVAIAADVPVLSVPDPGDGAADATDAGGLVVVAATPAQAARLALAATGERLSITVLAS